MEMVRAMLKNASLDLRLWAEALLESVDIRNCAPAQVLKNTTPFERLKGAKPKVSHFGVFGCLVRAHVPATKRKKFEDKSHPGVLIRSCAHGNCRVCTPHDESVQIFPAGQWENFKIMRLNEEADQEENSDTRVSLGDEDDSAGAVRLIACLSDLDESTSSNVSDSESDHVSDSEIALAQQSVWHGLPLLPMLLMYW